MRNARTLGTKDRIIVAMLFFFILIGVTLELYWIVYRAEMTTRDDVFARLLAIYWPADRTYRDPVLDSAQAFTLALETVNVFVSQWLNALLIVAILKGWPSRHWLQLTLSTYTAYGTFLYFWVAHLSGYATMAERTMYTFVLLYAANLPWLLGYGYMAWDSIGAIHRRFHATGRGSA